MKRIAGLVLLVGLLIFAYLSWARTPLDDRLLRVSDHATVSLPEIVADLKKARLVFVGELHDQELHHQAQLEVIRRLYESGVPVAVGLEMFRRDSQAQLDRWVKGEIREDAFQKIFFDNWGLPWNLYRDIFVFARDHKIPMVGLNVPREITRQIAREGFASLTPEQLGDMPAVSCVVDDAYAAFIRRSLGTHAHGEMSFTKFCEAQLFWDTAMAWNALRFLKDRPSSLMVVIAGSGHAWKRGIPAQLQTRTPLPFRVILPEIPGRLDRETVRLDDTDYLWLGITQ
ncbi:MAG TPA: ChaN family lipoprotein [Syntrophobacteria bacterium]|nr:ChaN family lipoprotein [Syntrophobacteria bacterium]